MPEAKTGDRVKVHYTGRLEDGTVFDSSRERAPLEFTLGDGKVIAGFDSAVEGMRPGEERSVWIPPEQGYGDRRDDLLLVVGRARFPGHIDLEPGQRLNMRREGEAAVMVTVAEVLDDEVVLDGNHPLAGREVTFEIELVAIA